MSTPEAGLPRRRLGDILVEARLITREQLASALEVQRQSGARLGEVLVGLGYVTELDVARTLSEQLGIPLSTELDADPSVARLVSEAVARQEQILPVRLEGERLVVATVDPLNVAALDAVAQATHREVQPVVVTPRALEQALERVYRLPRVSGPRPVAEPVRVADGGPVARLVHSILEQAVEERASDVHIEPLGPRVRVRLRVDGLLVERLHLEPAQLAPVVSRIKVMAGMDIAERRLPQDGRVEVSLGTRTVDVRISVLPTIHGEKVVLRLLSSSARAPRAEELGMSAEDLVLFRRLIHRPHGMILVAGPTGSGKTTTLMTAVAELNTVSRNIVTIEDPVEYRIEGVSQVQVQPKVGLTFAEGLRAILRQDPDVVTVGEIRDRETAEIAVRAGLTGHLVLSTLHTASAPETLTRLLEMGIEPYLVASSVVGVVAQRLVRRVCPRCAREERLADGDPAAVLPGLGVGERVMRATGCQSCNQTGYRGRTGIFELLPVTREIRRHILAKSPVDQLQEAMRAEGRRSLVEDGVEKVRAGVTSPEEVLRVVHPV